MIFVTLFWKYTPVASAVNTYYKYFHESVIVFRIWESLTYFFLINESNSF